MPDREYFFTVLSTTMGDWLLDQIAQAQKLRKDVIDEERCAKRIEMTAEQLDELETCGIVASKCSKP